HARHSTYLPQDLVGCVHRRDPRRLGRGPRDRLPRRGGADVRRGARSLGRPAAPRGSTGGKPPLAAENDIGVAVLDYSNPNVIVEQPQCRSRRSRPIGGVGGRVEAGRPGRGGSAGSRRVGRAGPIDAQYPTSTAASDREMRVISSRGTTL